MSQTPGSRPREEFNQYYSYLKRLIGSSDVSVLLLQVADETVSVMDILHFITAYHRSGVQQPAPALNLIRSIYPGEGTGVQPFIWTIAGGCRQLLADALALESGARLNTAGFAVQDQAQDKRRAHVHRHSGPAHDRRKAAEASSDGCAGSGWSGGATDTGSATATRSRLGCDATPELPTEPGT